MSCCGWRGQKNVHQPWPLAPLVFTVGFLTCLTITAFTDGHRGADAARAQPRRAPARSLVGAVESSARTRAAGTMQTYVDRLAWSVANTLLCAS